MKAPIRVFAIVSLAVLFGYAFEAIPETSTKPVPPSTRPDIGDETLHVRLMKQQQERIIQRLGVPAPLDANETTDLATGIDVVQELQDSGFILPATLEEVEAALRTAATTPDTEDDKAALMLRHRGSYRFYLND